MVFYRTMGVYLFMTIPVELDLRQVYEYEKRIESLENEIKFYIKESVCTKEIINICREIVKYSLNYNSYLTISSSEQIKALDLLIHKLDKFHGVIEK